MEQATKESIKMEILIIAAVLVFVFLVIWLQNHFYSKKELNEVISSAYSDGFDTALSRYGYYDDGYEKGYDDGYENGKQDGYAEGYDNGYDDGYEACYDNVT